MQHTITEPDVSYNYINALYFQTRKNRFNGCDKDKLRKQLGISDVESTNVLNKLDSYGWITQTGASVILTPDGWHYILGERRGKTHACVSFTGVTELRAEREASVYRFDYILRDNTLRQSSKTITVSIDHDLCREWEMRDFNTGVNKSALIKLLRRYAFDFISKHIVNGNLGMHEKLQLGAERLQHGCRYHADDLFGSESWEYEVEWVMHSRS